MPTTTSEVVPTGPYFGFTRKEMLAELERYKKARKRSGSNLLSSNINGQSFTFGPRQDWSLDEWQIAIQCSLYYISPGEFPFPPPANSALLAQR